MREESRALIGLILCIICGHIVLLLLLLLGDGTGTVALTRSEPTASRDALDALRREFAPHQVADSIFAPADYLLRVRERAGNPYRAVRT
jgi:hypothetical protein